MDRRLTEAAELREFFVMECPARRTSAIRAKAAADRKAVDVRKVPKAEVSALIDYAVGVQYRTGRNFMTDRLRGPG
jgi:hypothetical protein